MKYLLLFILSIVTLTSNSQSVTGTIHNPKGKHQKGIKIQVKGTKSETRSLADGTFVVPGVKVGDSLIVKPNNNKEATFAVNDTVGLVIIAEKNHIMVNDQVVFYKQEKKKDFNIITREDIEKSGARSIADILRGRVAGLQVSGVGDGTQMTIRGKNSFASKTDPLFILDGAEVTFTLLNSLNLETVESIEVSKTGAGYGVRGANGVIIVKTRRQ